jgi:hypothetical protein
MNFSDTNFFKPLEAINIHTTLGIRFWDPVRNIQVRDHLTVTALSEGRQDNPVLAVRTASGIYCFQRLPGMFDIEYGRQAGDRTGSPPASATFVINVADLASRFLPVAFSIDLPLDYKGPFLDGVIVSELEDYLRNTSPPRAHLPGFLLFSAPARTVTSGLAVIRANMIDHTTGAPAAHAFMQVKINGGKSWYGIADENGNIATLFPYPQFESTFHDSPPPGGYHIESPEQHWDVSIRIKYDPESLVYQGGSRLPDLRSILGQMEALIWTVSPASVPGSEPVEQWDTRLTFGKEMVLKTEDEPHATLLIDRNIST